MVLGLVFYPYHSVIEVALLIYLDLILPQVERASELFFQQATVLYILH